MGAAACVLSVLNTESGLWAGRMGHVCLSGGLFAVGVWAVCRLAPRLPAALRSWLWWLVCLKMLLDLCSFAPLSLPLLPAAPARRVLQAASQPVGPLASFQLPPAGKASGATALSVPDPAHFPDTLSPAAWRLSGFLGLQILWLAGALFGFARTLRQALHMRQFVQAAAPVNISKSVGESVAASLGLRQTPRILESADVSAPCVTGAFRPVILLPISQCRTFSPDEMRLTLAHEMAHIRRADLRLAVLPALVQILFYFYPLAWLALREWAAAREEACDALALDATGAAPARLGYLLLKLAGKTAQTPALSLSPEYHTLRRRLVGLTLPSRPANRAVWLPALALLCVLPWRLTAATPALSLDTTAPDALTVRYAVSDLGDVTEAAALNDAGQAALTRRQGNEAQGLAGGPDALAKVGALPKHHFSVAYGINSQGQIAAASYNIPGRGRALLWDGSPHRLGSLPGYPYSEARAVNDAGQVAGYAATGGHDRWKALIARAFVWQTGTMTGLGTLGGPYSCAYDLNNQDQVVGKADTGTFGATHAFLWQNGQMQDLGTLGGANSVACHVNDAGVVVGSAETGDGETRHAFVWQNGTMRDLGALPGLPDSVACAVNTPGQIVGYAEPQPDSSDKRAVLWQGGHALDLNALLPAHSGWVFTEARAINDRGQIAGNGTLNGQPRAFLLTPR